MRLFIYCVILLAVWFKSLMFLHKKFQVPFSSLTWYFSSLVGSPCLSWRQLWANTLAKEASLPGERSALSLRVKDLSIPYQTKIEFISFILIFNCPLNFLSLFTIFCTGLGYGTQVILILLNFYYIIVLAWAIFYFYHSFSWELPWSSCQNVWNLGKKWQ